MLHEVTIVGGPQPGLFFLFAQGKRPTRAHFIAALEKIARVYVSFDPESSEAANVEPAGDWIEIVRDGLTFDVLGLASGPSLSAPEIRHRFACPADLDGNLMDAVAILPGPHIASGAASMPILRALLSLGAELVTALEGSIDAICWPPARSAIAADFFRRSVGSWLDGGPFPALGLIGFELDEAGCLISEGFRLFNDQELRFSATLSADRIAATRIAVRLINEFVALGPLSFTLDRRLEDGARIVLTPSPDRRWIEVAML